MELKLLRLFQPKNPDKPLGGRYKIISQLGAGGFGQTFLAVDLHLPGHPQCVVKQLKPKVSDANSLQTARRLFDIEAKVLYQLGNHDQIPRLLAHFEDNKEFYLAQELIEGKPLNEELVAAQPWSEARVIALLQDMLYVLAFVHQQHVIHRDIKPSNLIRRQHDGRIVLIDFGAVKQASVQIVPKSGQTHTISIGTQGYTPKEQLGGNPRFSSDVYAAGMVGIQALTGVNPRYLKEDPQTGEINWRGRAPQVSPELAAILECMVRYDFRTRYPTAAEALAALQCLPTAIAQSLPLPQQPLEGTETLPGQVVELPRTATNLMGGTEQTETAQSQPASSGTAASSASTNIWTPTEISAQSHLALSSTDSIESPNLQPTQQAGSGRRTVVVPTILNRRRPITLWSILAALSTVGVSFFIARVTLFAQPSGQIADHSSVSVPSPAPSTEESASPSPSVSSVSSPIVNPREESGLSPVSSPTINPSAEPVSPAPTSSPSVNPSPKPVPPAPITPVVNPSPKPVPPAPITPVVNPAPIPNKKPTQPSPASPPATTPAPPKVVPSTTTSTSSSSKAQATKLMRQANRLRETKQYQKAVDLYDQLIAIKPDIAEAHWGRCYSLNSIQQPEEAIAACNRALAINPNYPEALWSKGTALDQQQRHPDALKLYEQATALKPDFADAWNNQGVSLLGLGRYSEAIAAFDKAAALKPGFADAWANRGAALWEQKRFNAAITSFDKALQIDPNNQNAVNLRQQAREKLGR